MNSRRGEWKDRIMHKMRKQEHYPIQGITKPVPNAVASGTDDVKVSRKAAAAGLLLSAMLSIAPGLCAFGSDAGAEPAPPPLTDIVPQLAPTTPPTPPSATPLVAAPDSAPGTNTAGARIQFATPVYDFGKVRSGELVKYAYAFTNIGDRLLELTAVRPSCGCTTAGEWSRKVEPGQTGSIPIQFNSGNFNGQVAKTITVTCNDTNKPSVVLQLKGTIWKAVDVTPQYAVLNLTVESPTNSTTVRIVSNEEGPLTLFAPESNNKVFDAEVKTNQPGKEFLVIIKAVPPLPLGSTRGIVSLKTSSTNMPIISITAIANVQPAVGVAPSQITLPAAPLAKAMSYTVSIRNNGTNSLALSEPALNVQGVDVRLREVQQGRYFTVTLNFPEGLVLSEGEKVELNVKSNHPLFPLIKVPVRQLPHPAPVAASAPRQSGPPPVPSAIDR